MTKEELNEKVEQQKIAINDANNKICFEVKKYIKSLPFKVGDKVSCTRFGICWIASIIPERGSGGFCEDEDEPTQLIFTTLDKARSKIPKDHYSKENGSREYYIKKIEIE